MTSEYLFNVIGLISDTPPNLFINIHQLIWFRICTCERNDSSHFLSFKIIFFRILVSF